MKGVVVVVFLLTFLSCTVRSAKILGVLHMGGRSHYFLIDALMRALAERGHDVTLISPFEDKDPPKNGSFRNIVLTGMLDEMKNKFAEKKSNFFESAGGNQVLTTFSFFLMLSGMTEKTLSHPNVQELINSGETFDAVILVQFMNDGLKALAPHFKAPLIVFNSAANSWVNPMVGNPSPPSYVPEILLGYSSHMTFTERVINCLARLLNDALHHWYFYPQQRNIVKQYLPNAPEFDDYLYNVSLMLLNSHVSLNQPVPHVPNMVEISGFHIKPPKKLSKELQEFLDNANEGVIYFSMGSNLRSLDLPEQKRDALLRAFGKLKQKVLWKWETDELPRKPANVKVSKWVPQQDVLAHPNIKLFITHGGYLSTTETVYHGVPILAIPIAGDQIMNAKIATDNGIGLTLGFPDLTEESLIKNIKELLENPKYTINAKTSSKIFHDRPVGPLDTTMYWIEYVIRHQGAPHLRVAGVDLPWYKYHILDVIGFLIIAWTVA